MFKGLRVDILKVKQDQFSHEVFQNSSGIFSCKQRSSFKVKVQDFFLEMSIQSLYH